MISKEKIKSLSEDELALFCFILKDKLIFNEELEVPFERLLNFNILTIIPLFELRKSDLLDEYKYLIDNIIKKLIHNTDNL